MPQEVVKNQFRDRLELILKREYLIIRFAAFALFLVTVAKMLTLELSSLVSEREWLNSILQVGVGAGVVIIALISTFAAFLSHKSERVSSLNFSVTTAYEKALNESRFNPHQRSQLTNEHSSD